MELIFFSYVVCKNLTYTLYLNKKYEKELLLLKRYLNDTIFVYNVNGLKANEVKKKLEEFNNILPAIGYVNLGLIKEIIRN